LGDAENLLESARAEIDQLMAIKLSNEDKAREASVQAAGVRDSISEQLAVANVDNAEVFIRDDNSIGIRVGSGRLFRTGSSTLSGEGQEVLGVVGEIVQSYPDYDVRVEGHTDNVPIGPVLAKTFKSNWELSVARAASAVRFMSSSSGIAADKLSATGYGEYNPIADNNTDEGKEQNRRVEVILHQQ
jgi:chemotaxis protein MotB